MWSPRSFDLIPRMMARRSIIVACRGRCSQISMPGTFVAIGRNSPRTSAGAAGFMSQLSMCDGPPRSQIQMTDLPRWVPLLACRAVPGEAIACSLNSSASVNPPSPSAPTRKMSLREMPGLHSVAGPRSVSIGNASVDTGQYAHSIGYRLMLSGRPLCAWHGLAAPGRQRRELASRDKWLPLSFVAGY